jgi:undecaprenyl-diphosphatase
MLVGFGIYQLIKRKSLLSVDKYILMIGIFFVILLFFWLLFDKLVVINNRPIFVEGKTEPSFPSTHTLLVVFIYLSAYTVIRNLTNNKMYQNIVLCLAITISLIVSISRVLAGMHYITDVLGGILLGLTLFFLSFGLSFDNKKIEE